MLADRKSSMGIRDGGVVRVYFDRCGIIGKIDRDGIAGEFSCDVKMARNLVGETPEFKASVLLPENGSMFAGNSERQVRLRPLCDREGAGGNRKRRCWLPLRAGYWSEKKSRYQIELRAQISAPFTCALPDWSE